ncbi:hypothetical protein JD77_00300 [Micromonospora olivasterospora]|uniref:Uncharacterized protein n=1 Tax=Micromonospora olivasterospora TaxID=1880 RepID=A0A562I3T7_MICOL|nr:hypothetical protein JD77_00300 [Micromonospora olivasterospora]
MSGQARPAQIVSPSGRSAGSPDGAGHQQCPTVGLPAWHCPERSRTRSESSSPVMPPLTTAQWPTRSPCSGTRRSPCSGTRVKPAPPYCWPEHDSRGPGAVPGSDRCRAQSPRVGTPERWRCERRTAPRRPRPLWALALDLVGRIDDSAGADPFGVPGTRGRELRRALPVGPIGRGCRLMPPWTGSPTSRASVGLRAPRGRGGGGRVDPACRARRDPTDTERLAAGFRREWVAGFRDGSGQMVGGWVAVSAAD